MRKLFLITLTCIILPLASYATSLVLKSHAKEYNLLPYIYTATDSSNEATIEDIIGNTAFEKLQSKTINFGYSEAGNWIRFDIENPYSQTKNLILSINYPLLNHIQFYETENGNILKKTETGELHPQITKEYPSRNFVFKLSLPPNSQRTYYIYAYCDGDTVCLPLSLIEEEYFFEFEIQEYLMLGILYGIFAFLIIFCLLYFIELGDRVYNFYLGYVAFLFLSSLCIQGLHQQFLFPNLYWWNDHAVMIYLHLAYIFSIFFMQGFLQLQKRHPLFNRIFDIYKIVSLFSLILTFLDYPFFVYSILIISSALIVYFITSVSISAILFFKNNVAHAIYPLISNTILLIGLIIHLSKDLGLLPANNLVSNATHTTFLLESLILFMAILNRFKRMQNDAKEELRKKNNQILSQKEELEMVNSELEKLSMVASETANSVALFSRFGDLEWINYGFERIYGYTQPQLKKQVGNSIYKIYRNDELPQLISKCLAVKESVTFETLQRSKYGNKVWVNTTLTPYVNENDEVVKLIAIDSDITELKHVQRELIIAKDKAEEANRIKTTFLANVSHEIRTPLNAIIGFTDLILLKKQTAEKQRKFIKIINNNGYHLLDVINDIIDISKIESGMMDFYAGNFSILDLLKETYEEFKYRIPTEKDVVLSLIINVDNRHDIVYSDRIKMKQVLLNLLGNALKFTEKGRIDISISYDNEANPQCFEISVKDTGIGIAPSKQKNIFERFRQADESITRDFGGAGLGLPISKGLIEIIGGKIWVNSEENEGAEFIFTQPLSFITRDNIPNTEHSKLEYINLKDKKIVIVEYQEEIVNFVKELLSETKAVVISFTDTDEAEEYLLMHNDVDIMLLDIQMHTNSYSIVKSIHKINSDLKIIALTSIIKPEIRYQCLQAGCVDYLTKPINSRLLMLTLKRLLLESPQA